MKRKIGIITLLLCALVCFGCYACGESGNTDSSGKNPHIVIETDATEFVAKVNDTYTTPYAGVYDDNLDRVDYIDNVEVSVTARIYNSVNAEIATLRNGDTLNFRFLSAGTWKIVYSVDDTNKVEPATITVTVCTQLASPLNIKKENGAISWDSVEGASGYAVSVNGKEAVATGGTSFTSDVIESSGFYVSVVAKGDNLKWVDSEPSLFIDKTPLKDGELSAFNDPTYEFDVVEGYHPTGVLNPEPSDIVYLTEEECQGSTGGALKMRIKSGAWGWGIFKIALSQNLDMSKDFAGIEIRYKVDTEDYLLNAGANNNYTTSFFVSDVEAANNNLSSGELLYKENNDQWRILKVTKKSLEQRKYVVTEKNENGVYDFLQLNLYNLTRTTGKGDLYFDYIRFYEDEIVSPQNAKIENGTLSWDAVDGAVKYSVVATKIVNGETVAIQYETKENVVVLDKIGIVADEQVETQIKITAISDGNKKASSEAAVKNYHVLNENELANFDIKSYNDDITCGPVASNSDKPDYTDMRTSGYASNVEGSTNGAMYINKWICSYGSGSNFEGMRRNVVFGIKLQNGLDVTKNIVVRFKIDAQDFSSGETGLQLVGADSDTQNYTGYDYRKVATVGEWTELKLSASDLAACGYENGDTLIVFALRNTAGVSIQGAAKIYIDYIRYEAAD